MSELLSESRILIVDDESININILGESLSDDYIVTAANSGEEALRIIQKERKPDLILLDVMMPDMTGFEVCQKIKDNKETSNISIIFVTYLDDKFNEETGFKLGACDYIQKPISPSLVKARVKVHLENIRCRKLLELMVQLGEDELKNLENKNKIFREYLSTYN